MQLYWFAFLFCLPIFTTHNASAMRRGPARGGRILSQEARRFVSSIAGSSHLFDMMFAGRSPAAQLPEIDNLRQLYQLSGMWGHGEEQAAQRYTLALKGQIACNAGMP